MRDPTTPGVSAPRRPRVFYGWYIVGASSLSNALLTAAFFTGFQAYFLPILNTFGWSRTAISGAFSLRQFESGLLSPLIGFLVDRVGPRRLIIAGAVISGLGLIGLSQTRNLFMFYAFFLIISLGTSAVGHSITWPIVVARWFRRRLGLAMGLATTGPVIGVPFLFLNVMMVNNFGWRQVIFWYGILLLMTLVPLGLMARERPQPYGYLPDGDVPDTATPIGGGEGGSAWRAAEPGLTARQALATREFWVFALILAGLFMSNIGFHTHQVPYFEAIGLSTTAAAATVVIAMTSSGIGRLGAGWLVDRIDYRLVLAGVGLLMSSAMLFLAIAPVNSLAWAVPFSLAFGISLGCTVPIRAVVASTLFGMRALGTILGLLSTFFLIGGVLGPLLLGYVFDTTGSYQSGIWILAAVNLATVPLLLLMGPSSRLAGSGGYR